LPEPNPPDNVELSGSTAERGRCVDKPPPEVTAWSDGRDSRLPNPEELPNLLGIFFCWHIIGRPNPNLPIFWLKNSKVRRLSMGDNNTFRVTRFCSYETPSRARGHAVKHVPNIVRFFPIFEAARCDMLDILPAHNLFRACKLLISARQFIHLFRRQRRQTGVAPCTGAWIETSFSHSFFPLKGLSRRLTSH